MITGAPDERIGGRGGHLQIQQVAAGVEHRINVIRRHPPASQAALAQIRGTVVSGG